MLPITASATIYSADYDPLPIVSLQWHLLPLSARRRQPHFLKRKSFPYCQKGHCAIFKTDSSRSTPWLSRGQRDFTALIETAIRRAAAEQGSLVRAATEDILMDERGKNYLADFAWVNEDRSYTVLIPKEQI